MRAVCPFCSDQAKKLFSTRDYNRNITKDEFIYCKCNSCGLVFVSSVPSNLGLYYPLDYYRFFPSLEQFEKNLSSEEYKLKLLRQFKSCGNLLEIGSVTGGFAYLAKKNGYSVQVMEMDQRCCEFISKTLGIPAIQSEDVQNDLPKEKKFEIISLWHVIEHLPKPWEVLKGLVDRLEPEGILILAAPNPEAFQFKCLNEFWAHVDAPRHLHLFPMAHLRDFMASLGCRVVFETTQDAGSRHWNEFGWKYSIANQIPGSFLKKCGRLLGKIIHKLVTPFEMKEGKGSAYTLVFQRERV